MGDSIVGKIVKTAHDKKAGDIELIRVGGLTPLADYFVILTGTSTTHVRALCDEIEKKLKDEDGVMAHHVEGYNAGSWILLDYGNILVHIFLADTRRFYSLERLWSDAPREDISAFIE